MDPTTSEHEPHLIPYRTYVNVWLALIGLTLVTVAAAYADLGHMAIFTAILIATIKSTLVLLYFMHMRYEKPVFVWFLVAALGTYGLFIILTFADYAFR